MGTAFSCQFRRATPGLIAALALAVLPPLPAVSESFDWRNVGGQSYLTSVKTQGPAGACWAFAAIGTLEAKYLITRNDPSFQLDLSEQHLICPGSMGTISGGWEYLGLDYFTSTGVVTEAELPYTGQNTSPLWDTTNNGPIQPGWQNRVVKSTHNNDWMLPADTASIKAELKAYGPLCVALHSTEDINTTRLGTSIIDHALVVVGYVDDSSYAGGGYWIVKNSWGPTWNGNGYGRVMYGNLERHARVHAIDGLASYVGSMGTLTWNASGVGDWSTSAGSWTNGSTGQAWTNGEYSAVFSSAAPGGATITLANVSAHQVDVNSGATGYTLNGGRLLVTGGGINAQEDLAINSTVALGMTQTWTVAVGKTLTVGGGVKMHVSSLTVAVGDNGQTVLNGALEDVSTDPAFAGLLTGYHPSLTKTGSGTLSLNAANAYTGDTRVAGGALQIGHALALQNSTLDMAGGDTGTVTLAASSATLGGLKGARGLTLPAAFTLAVGNNNADTTYSGGLGGAGGLTKIGNGTLALTFANTYSGPTVVTTGILRLGISSALPGGTGATGGTSNLAINGGVVGLAYENFARALGSGAAQVQWTGSGGFAAFSVDRTVNLGNAGATLVWGSGSFVPQGSALVLGAPSADRTLIFQNPINLGTEGRTVRVDLGSHGTVEVDDAILSGALSGSAAVTKTGAGLLSLTGGNAAHTGGWTVNAGAIAANSSAALGTGPLAFAAGTALRTTGAGAFAASNLITLGGNVTFDLRNTAGTTLSGRVSGAGGLTKTGSGTLVLAAPNTYSGITDMKAGALTVADPLALQNSTLNTNLAAPVGFSGISAATLGGLQGNGNLSLPNGFALAVGANHADTTYSGVIGGDGSLSKTGSGTLTLANAMTYIGATVINGGTIKLVAQPPPGLYEGSASGWDTARSNPGNTVVFTTRMANSLTGWTSNTTYFYSGYLNNNTGGDVTWTFAEKFDDAAYLKIDSTVVLNDTVASTQTSSSITLSPGPHALMLQVYNNTGAAGPYRGSGVDGATQKGVAYKTSPTGAWLALTDPGDGSLFTLTPPGLLPATTALQLGGSSGSPTFDLSGATQQVASLSDHAGHTNGVVTSTGATLAALVLNSGAGTSTFSGAITGPVGIVKRGNSTQVLAGINSYSGGTSIAGGTLIVANANALGTAGAITNSATLAIQSGVIFSRAVAFTSGSTLAGLGTYSPAGGFTVGSGVTVAPGIGDVGTLTLGGDAAFAAGSVLSLDIVGAVADRLDVAGLLDTGGPGNTLALHFSDATAGRYTLATFGSVNVGTNSVSSGGFAAATGLDPAYRLEVLPGGKRIDLVHRAIIGAIATSPAEPSIITGGTTAFTTTVGNSAPINSDGLVCTLTAGMNTTGSAVYIGPVPGQASSPSIEGLSFNGTAVGPARPGTFTVADPTATNGTQTGTVTVDVYDHATTGDFAGGTLHLPNLRPGYAGPVSSTDSLIVTNGAATDYRAALKGSGGDAQVALTAFNGLSPGNSATISASLVGGLPAGPIQKALAYTFADDSPLNGHSTDLAHPTIHVAGSVYDYANPTVAPTVLDFGIQHARVGTLVRSLPVANAVIANAAYQDKLDATATTSNGSVTALGFQGLGAGASRNVVFTADLGHAGPLSGSVTLDFHSAPIAPGLTGRDTTDSVSVTTAGGIYSGRAEWNRLPGGEWNVDASWKDTQSSLLAGTPGLPGFSADTALFGRVIGNVPATVLLAGFNPTVSELTFDNLEAGYTIAQGSGGTLVLGGGSGASIAVLSGAHTIAAPLELADDLTVSGPEVLIISGQIQGVDKSLTKSDGGLLLLSNAQNTYSGGTIVTGGLVLVTNAGALPAGGSLTIGAGAAVELDIGITGTPPVARARSVAAVPEPGTLALVVAAVIAVAALSSRRLLH